MRILGGMFRPERGRALSLAVVRDIGTGRPRGLSLAIVGRAYYLALI